MVLKRLSIVALVLALVVGTTARLMPHEIGAPMASAVATDAAADMADGCAKPPAPCNGLPAGCIDHLGCLSVAALPASPMSPPTAFAWSSVAYRMAAASLAGRSVEPELSPPIRAG